MRQRITTCMWGTAWERYGRRFAETFAEFWPKSVELVIYSSRSLPLARGECRDLLAIPGLQEFLKRHRNNPEASGHGKPTDRWRAEHRASGYCWRYDATKWVYQALTPQAAAQDMTDGDVLAWFDADTFAHSPIPEGWIETLIGDADLAYPGRDGGSEIGFIGFRLGAARPVIDDFADLYLSDRIFSLAETHSAFVFDEARRLHPEVKARNLTPGLRGHVWPQSPLAAYTEHLKGKRKDGAKTLARIVRAG